VYDTSPWRTLFQYGDDGRRFLWAGPAGLGETGANRQFLDPRGQDPCRIRSREHLYVSEHEYRTRPPMGSRAGDWSWCSIELYCRASCLYSLMERWFLL